MAYMKAYAVVGPKNVHPRFFRFWDNAMDAGELETVCSTAKSFPFGSKRQIQAARESSLSMNSCTYPALLMVVSILPRYRTILSFFSSSVLLFFDIAVPSS
jgi:hypothetical protein